MVRGFKRKRKLQSIRPVNKAKQRAVHGVGSCVLNFGIVTNAFKCFFSPALMESFLSVAKICDRHAEKLYVCCCGCFLIVHHFIEHDYTREGSN